MPCGCNQRFEEITIIEAPPALVYAMLTDFDNYGSWNTVIPAVKVKEFKEGARTRLDLTTTRGRLSIKASLKGVDPEAKSFGWEAHFPIPGMFKTVFSFVMQPVAESAATAEGGATVTRLIRSETYKGLMVPVFGFVIRDTDKRLDEMVLELKMRAEAAARGPPPEAAAAAPEAAAAAPEAAAAPPEAAAAPPS